MTKLRQITNSTHQVIDYKIGIAGAIFLGGVVFGINYFATHEITDSVTTDLKQGRYTFLLGDRFLKGCENFGTTLKKGKQPFFLPDNQEIGCGTIYDDQAPVEQGWPMSRLKTPERANFG
jgi:hypothetical protein